MSFFRRPGDSSSEDSSSSSDSDTADQETEADFSQNSAQNSVHTIELSETEEIVDGPIEDLVLSKTISNDEHGNVIPRERVRDMAIASLLQELSRYKAAELLNDSGAISGHGPLSKDSPQVQELAEVLFNKSSSVLERGNILSLETSNESDRTQRTHFMTQLERLSYQGAPQSHSKRTEGRDSAEVSGIDEPKALVALKGHQPHPYQNTKFAQVQQLAYEMGNMGILSRPGSQVPPVPLLPTLSIPSQYRSNFEEVRQLGRGGFGIVMEVSHHLDGQKYAVKRVALSPEQAKAYLEHGQTILGQILDEVKVLAALDHPNIVRYITAWIDPPSRSSSTQRFVTPRPKLLLQHGASTDVGFSDPFQRSNNVPFQGRILGSVEPPSSTSHHGSYTHAAFSEDEFSDDPFVRQRNDPGAERQLWSVRSFRADSQHDVEDTSNIFTDGRSRRHTSLSTKMHDLCFTLNIQMAIYPMTLTNYLQPEASATLSTPRPHRHCFHLVPALRILLSILCGLQYIHSHGLLHRDIKPSNIFLTVHDLCPPMSLGWADIGSCPSCRPLIRFINPRIGDFGLVKLQDSIDERRHSHSGDSANIGTEFYRPPRSEGPVESDEKLDVFALGVILLELLWRCGTKMERFDILKSAQSGQACIMDGLKGNLVREGFGQNVAEQVQVVVSGMIDPNPRLRWRCAMVKSAVEDILQNVDNGARLEDDHRSESREPMSSGSNTYR